ncbi:hypothetical protein [Nocardiopsis sp. FR6]|uniref:hypothetical protein n=1 Tax=Nocardiopsis sp. FR6 TaxID=2605986 RepID=UPI001358E8DB|nr:hypothetical protein [Nocardiopsis sp. FR6]
MTESIYAAVHACLSWARTIRPRPAVDPDSLLFLLTEHRQAGAPDPGDWYTADVRAVARTVRSWDRVPGELRPTWLAWCDYLVDRGLLRSSESPRQLRAAIAAVDLSPGGPDGEAAGEPPPALERLRAEGGRGSAPPVVPAEPDALDAAARRCPPLVLAARLAEWVGAGRALRPGFEGGDALGDRDAARAAEAVGVCPRRIPALFAVARDGGLLRTTYTRVLPGPALPAWREGAPGAAADVWADALAAMAAPRGVSACLLLDDLFTSGRARTPAQLAALCLPGERARVRQVLEALVGLGAVARADGGRFLVTGLGDHCMVRLLRRSGGTVVLTPTVARMDARLVFDLLEEGRPVDTGGLLERWVAARDTGSAVRGLFGACDAPGDWHRRVRAAGVLAALEEAPVAVLESYAHHPVLGGWARRLRGARSGPVSHQEVWSVLDEYAVLLDRGGPLPARDGERYAGCAREFVRTVRLTGHPASDTVLDLLAREALGRALAEAAAEEPAESAGRESPAPAPS